MKMKTRREKLEDVKCAGNMNLGLWLNKFIGGQNVGKANSDEENCKQKLIEESSKTIRIFDDYELFFKRRQENLAQIEPNIFRAVEIDSRMICGLGAASVWENAISIHRTYGVPFIPGSSLKGLAASYAHKYLGEEWRKETWDKQGKKITELGEYHKFVFGSQESAGFVTFHDALITPESTKKQFLHADIMTVHHRKYYGGENVPPADWDSPTPINFVSASGSYLLALTTVEGGEKWLEITARILEEAFRIEGIGAKTSSGYGRATLTDKHLKTEAMIKREEAERQAEIKSQKEEVRLAEERRREEKQLTYEGQQQAKIDQKQQNENSKVERLYEQITAIDSNTKKIEKEFKNISKSIYKIENAEQKKALAAAALERIEQWQSENVKIDFSGKWFASLKKMNGGN